MTPNEIKRARAVLKKFPLDCRVEFIASDREEFSDERLFGTVQWINDYARVCVKWDKPTSGQIRTVWAQDLRRCDDAPQKTRRNKNAGQ